MSASTLASDIVLFAGCAIVVLASWAMLAVNNVRARLHFLAPVTSFGGPLIALALMLANGLGLTTAQIALIAVLLALSGPALGIAIGRAVLQRDDQVDRDEPE